LNIGNETRQRRRAVIVGANSAGQLLANRICGDSLNRFEFLGYFDDRHLHRFTEITRRELLGRMTDLPAYVKANNIHNVYISLPMSSHPRVTSILDELRDSTVSIYFVPDFFIFDLIQARFDHVVGIPVVAVCESPFVGLNGMIKRMSDIAFSLAIMALVWPVMLAVAVAVKVTSPGPVLFKQRRYGEDGESITVYKFRSMTVLEDGSMITQAKKNDQRLTPIGAFIRKTSLDELPQLLNILQGDMSIVGPRPHANAHNELYRKVIKGYMIRHKVKPGLTGWAQVNGLRGETDSVEKMKRRIDFDLDYLRHWSIWLDLKIILKTIAIVARDKNAY
jgi:putative colanic acid biosynthesis UDP-glucose lipid carrier transferase